MTPRREQLRKLTAGELRQLGLHALTYLKKEGDGWRLYCADGTAVMGFADEDEALGTAHRGGFEVLSLH